MENFIEIEKPNISKKCNYLNSIPIITPDISYNSFFCRFLIENQACIIQNVSSKWNSSCFWHMNGRINFDYLNSKFGNSDAMLYDCREKYFNSQKTINVKFKEFLQYWKAYINSNYDINKPLYYLKDWHLKQLYPQEDFYEVPSYFSSDWINEYLIDNSKDDYRFVYMGPKGSWTPFHADVFNSFSWSTNVCGKKKWLLFLPGTEDGLRDSLGNLPYDVIAVKDKVPHFELIQNAGDAVFVPSGWYHQVWNMEDTISVNHNWVNGCNIKNMWNALEKGLADVKNEIKDCLEMDDFMQHCQVMLNAYFGLDFQEFYTFLLHISKKRISFIKDKMPVILYGKEYLGLNHALFDLLTIKDVLNLFIKHGDTDDVIQKNSVEQSPIELYKEIVEITDDL